MWKSLVFFIFNLAFNLFPPFFFPSGTSLHISQKISPSFITYLVHYILHTLDKYHQKPITRAINGSDKDYNKMEQEKLTS